MAKGKNKSSKNTTKPKNPKQAVDKAAAEAKKKDEATKPPEEPKAPVETPVKPPEEEKKKEELVVKPKPPVVKQTPCAAIKNMLESYRVLCTKKAFGSEDRKKIVKKLSDILVYAIRYSSERGVLNALYMFLDKERSGIMAPQTVFQGISTLGQGQRMRIEVFYTAFTICLSNKGKKGKARTKVDMDRVRQTLNEDAVAFLASKNR